MEVVSIQTFKLNTHFVFVFFFVDKLGTRHFVTFMLFLGMANAYVMRTNMSVAIVAMVNHTALGVEKELIDDECPDANYGNTTVSISIIICSKIKIYLLKKKRVLMCLQSRHTVDNTFELTHY